jgi:hypothetical protein
MNKELVSSNTAKAMVLMNVAIAVKERLDKTEKLLDEYAERHGIVREKNTDSNSGS